MLPDTLTAGTAQRYASLTRAIEEATPDAPQGPSAFILYLQRVRPSAKTALLALSAYTLATRGTTLPVPDESVLAAPSPHQRRTLPSLRAVRGEPVQAVTAHRSARVTAYYSRPSASSGAE